MGKEKLTIGRLEHIELVGIGIPRVQAKIDSGAYTSAIHFQRIKIRRVDDQRRLVVLFQMGGHRKTIVFKKFKRVTVRSSNGELSRRYMIKTRVRLNGHVVNSQFTLFDRSDMKHQVLLGRKFLRGRFVVDVSAKNLLG
ncbi:MAG: RimK/LysX family protein [Bacteroidota bacterium]|nr:RimK/LysX family protein [Bacteroidota bacterium]